MVRRIREGDESAEVELYKVFSRGMRFYICRRLGPEALEDNIHDGFMATLEAIRKGQVRQPERLMGFVRTVVRRGIGERIEVKVQERSRFGSLDQPFLADIHRTEATPEQAAIEKERIALARSEVAKLPARDREILMRFYVQDQTKEQICDEMNLTPTQFRLAKSRTMAKLAAKTQQLRSAPIKVAV